MKSRSFIFRKTIAASLALVTVFGSMAVLPVSQTAEKFALTASALEDDELPLVPIVFPQEIEVSYTPGEGCVKLTWTEYDNAQKYAVCGYVNGAWTKLAETTGTSYTIKNLTAGTNYKVAVVAYVNGSWNLDYSNAITVTPKSASATYPTNIKAEYSEQFHQVRFTWDKVSGADKYGIAVYLSGKWRIQTSALTTNSFTTPKNLTPGKSYKVAVAARVNGTWDTENAIKNAVTITVK